jgi:arylsulfatase A-like enzyme
VALSRRIFADRLWLFGVELVWLSPLASGLLFLGFGAAYLPLSVAMRRLRGPTAVVATFVALAAFAAISQIEAIHWTGAALLASGLGVTAARTIGATPRRLGRLAARVVVGGVAVIAAAAGGQVVAERASWSSGEGSPVAGSRPNILLLVLDTVRAWNLGWYGYDRATTPALDRRFESGVIFDRALAVGPWTLPSHASMFTGLWPTELSANWHRPLDRAHPTVAEALRDAGYLTGGFVGNYRYVGGSTGLGRGFSRYSDYPINPAEALRMTGLVRRLLRIPKVQEWLGKNRILEATTAAAVNRDFLEWLDRVPDRPFFGFINYIDAHSPYLPPAPFDSIWTKTDSGSVARRYTSLGEQVFGRGPIPGSLIAEYLDGYDGALSYLDRQIDSLLIELARRGRLDNTVVILTSDHGEHFGEHRLIQHGNSLYLPVLHVPLVVWGPRTGLVPSGLRIPAPTSLKNLAATIVDLAAVPNPGIPGRSLAALWRADSLEVPPDTLFAAVDWHESLSRFPPSPLLDGSLRSLLLDSLHYIRRSDGREELYHLGRDFLETRNLAGQPLYRAALLEARRELGLLTATNRSRD